MQPFLSPASLPVSLGRARPTCPATPLKPGSAPLDSPFSSWPRPLLLLCQDPLSDSDSDSPSSAAALRPTYLVTALKSGPTLSGHCSSPLTTPPLPAASQPSLVARLVWPRPESMAPPLLRTATLFQHHAPLVATLRPSPQSPGSAHLPLGSSLQTPPSPLLHPAPPSRPRLQGLATPRPRPAPGHAPPWFWFLSAPPGWPRLLAPPPPGPQQARSFSQPRASWAQPRRW